MFVKLTNVISAGVPKSNGILRLCVEERVQDLFVFKNIILQSPFQNKTGLLQNPSGGGIVGIWLRVNSVKRKILETIIGESRNCFAGDAMSPEILAQPVTKLSRIPMDIFANANSDSADSYSV